MSRHRLEAYLDKVFGFSALVDALPEGREFPKHPWKKVFDAVFLGAAMQIPSLLQIEAECGDGALAKRIGPISDDTLGYALQRQSPEPVFALSCEIARRLKRNGVLHSDWSRGLVVGAALYLQAPFVKEVERLGLVWAFTLKENQPELLREAERLTQESPTGVHAEPGREIRYWHLPEVDWPVADRLVRVVKTVRIEHQRRVTVSEKDGHRIKSKTAATQESTNFYATNFEIGSVSPLFIHQFSRSRWRIDTEGFQTITTDCHLKHPAVHQTTALVVLTMIRFLAYTLSLVFYHRQVRSHAPGKCDTFHELAKRLAYWFLALSPNTS